MAGWVIAHKVFENVLPAETLPAGPKGTERGWNERKLVDSRTSTGGRQAEKSARLQNGDLERGAVGQEPRRIIPRARNVTEFAWSCSGIGWDLSFLFFLYVGVYGRHPAHAHHYFCGTCNLFVISQVHIKKEILLLDGWYAETHLYLIWMI